MKAGAMDRRITIQRKTVTQNDYGEEIATWSDLATVWAQLTYGKGSERFSADQDVAIGPATFRIRWSNAVKSVAVEDRINYDGNTYEIVDRREIGRREGLELDVITRTESPVTNG